MTPEEHLKAALTGPGKQAAAIDWAKFLQLLMQILPFILPFLGPNPAPGPVLPTKP